MNWNIIDKTKTKQPEVGKYSDWKTNLAEEGANRCVYCAIKDTRLGGIRNFHVEHYKPKSLFPDLTNIILNLFYACPICNVFKSDDWHEPTGNLDSIYYPDPSIFDYSDLFKLQDDGTLVGLNKSGTYIITKLGLNRNQLLIDRHFNMLLNSYEYIKEEFRQVRDQLIELNTAGSKAMLSKLVTAFDVVIDKKDQMYEAVPYEMKDTKK